MIRLALVGASFVITLLIASSALAASVAYQGYLYGSDGLPVNNGRVVAGTWNPSVNLDSSSYWYTYGDAYGNADGNSYYEAVADGTFTPLGPPISTNSAGFFQGVGTTNAPAGSKIWVYGFLSPALEDWDMVLGTSSSPSFTVTYQFPMVVNVALADNFIWGSHFNNGIRTEGGPVPEPATLGFVALGTAAMMMVRRRAYSR